MSPRHSPGGSLHMLSPSHAHPSAVDSFHAIRQIRRSLSRFRRLFTFWKITARASGDRHSYNRRRKTLRTGDKRLAEISRRRDILHVVITWTSNSAALSRRRRVTSFGDFSRCGWGRQRGEKGLELRTTCMDGYMIDSRYISSRYVPLGPSGTAGTFVNTPTVRHWTAAT